MEKKDFRSLLTDLIPLVRCKHMMGGNPAENENQHLVSQFYEAWLHLASDVLSQSGLDNAAFAQRLRNFTDVLACTDVIEVLTICQDAASILMDGSADTYSGFKDRLLVLHPVAVYSIPGLLSPVSKLLVVFFEHADVKAVSLRPVLQFLRFGKKLNFKAIGLEVKAIASYLEIEDRLSTVSYDPEIPLIKGMNQIMRCWLNGLSFKNLVPSHGTGSVAEGKLTMYEKYKRLNADTYLRVVFQEQLPEFFPCGFEMNLVRESRTIFVPKTFSKLRTISMEPTAIQYFQQGVMKRLYHYIDCHPYLGRRVQLRDQSQNRNMARQGSIDNSLSTIDLSAASDTVAWALVKGVFAGTPLLKWLYATRSKTTKLPNGDAIALKKFAPMGSALCFPIECLIFSAVVEYTTQKWCTLHNQAKPDYTVYGDDLVIPSHLSGEIIEALESLGFVVNKDKSFCNGPFRESCGGDYYEGFDVSSLYYRLPAFRSKRVAPEVYAAICSTINLCVERDLPILRSFLLDLIVKMKPYFSSKTTESPSLYSPFPTNFHVSQKWDENWQLWLGKFCTVSSRPVKRVTDDGDKIAYFVRLSQMAERNSQIIFDQPVSDITLHGSTIRLGWMRREVDGLVARPPISARG